MGSCVVVTMDVIKDEIFFVKMISKVVGYGQL